MATTVDFDDLEGSGSDEEIHNVPEMVSDGKRMRKVWRPGDGDGDSSEHVIERTMNTVKGHPTWKIYIDEVKLPIVRGSEDEPPHYVYLDDRACYAIYCSGAYNQEELREFWPWDFNHQANIKQGRMNRGHPAYLDDSNTEYAKGQLRRKGQWYTFYGEPETTEYKPRRPHKKSKIHEEVAKEFAERAARGLEKNLASLSGSAYETTNKAKEKARSLASPSKTKKPPTSFEDTAGLQPKRLPPRSPPLRKPRVTSDSPTSPSIAAPRMLTTPKKTPSKPDVGHSGTSPRKRRRPSSPVPPTLSKRTELSSPTKRIHFGRDRARGGYDRDDEHW